MIRNSIAGFATIGLILMLCVLGGIALTGSLMYQQRSGASMLDLTGQQAYQAARSGVEWSLYNSLVNNTCTNTNLTFPNTLSSFNVFITCTRTTINEGNSPRTTDIITSIACNAATCNNTSTDPLYVERRIQTSVVQ